MDRTSLRQFLALFTLALSTAPLSAGDIIDEISHMPENEYVESGKDLPWKERSLELPAWPRSSRLQEVEITYGGGGGNRYFIDLDALSVGDDGVVRYTVVIGEGGNNVYYEGIRCETRTYTTYAYGTGLRTFSEIEQRDWQYPDKRGWAAYRAELMEAYFCGEYGITLKLREIVRRIKYLRSNNINYDGYLTN